jgi:phenylpropionate dioxygenase-like ring-hydroxylating dioxygenase large terminal subunit
MGLTPAKPYEDLLGDALEALLGKGTNSLDAFADGVNQAGVRGPRGEKWTASLLGAELARLGVGDPPSRRPLEPAGQLVTQPRMAVPKTAEELLETGLLNLWYLVARSSDVTDRPVALTRLGRKLVLWRGDSGQINVTENYCPHRGAPLSMGFVANGNVVCPYHGVQVAGDGTVAAVPPTPDCPLVGQKLIKAYPCREHAGAIWAYFGDDAHQAPSEPIFPEELSSDEWTGFLYTDVWKCNWQLSLDNRTDPVHGSFLHTGTFTLSYGRQDTELKIERKPTGFETYRTNQRGVNIDWHKVVLHPDNTYWVHTEIPYPPGFGGGSFRIVGFLTPIDRDTTYFWVYRSRKLAGWQRDLWRFLYKNRLVERADFVVNQDRVLLETIPLAARQRENLIQTDTALARMRRHLRNEATRQVEALARLGTAAQ